MELQFCNEHGIPHSEFLNWQVTDRAKAVAFVIEKNSRCSLCGTANWEWDQNRFAYEAVESNCRGCYIKEVSSEDSKRAPGVTIELMPTGTKEAAQRLLRAKRRHEQRERPKNR